MAEKIIEFDRVVAGYSESLTILNETTLDVRKGEITLLIGPNGAGKSTVLKTLFGLLVPRSGEVRFEGRVINGRSQRAADLELLLLAARHRRRLVVDALADAREAREHLLDPAGELRARQRDAAELEVVPDRQRAEQVAALRDERDAVGEERALLLRPRVLLIDEPSIGLSPKLVVDVMTLLRQLAEAGTTVLMVEQNVRTALKYSDRALVLEMGRLALDRPASELLGDPDLNRLFLGGHAPAVPGVAA